jgi:hypothetical protein
MKSQLAKKMAPKNNNQETLANSFKTSTPKENYTKRITLDLTKEQHVKLKIMALQQETTMAQTLRNFIHAANSEKLKNLFNEI